VVLWRAMGAISASSPSGQAVSIEALVFDERGLIPVAVQDHLTGEIRMFAFANRDAVRATLASGRATFWSRSRGELWEKGKTSGNPVHVAQVLVDCDADCLVYSGDPEGGTCHTGRQSCFFRVVEGSPAPREGEGARDGEPPQTLLTRLESVLESRKATTGEKSYTKSLYDKAPAAIASKLREEADELARAVEGENDDRVASEAADVLYHLLVALRWRSIPLRRVLGALARRLGTSGHAEKAARPKT
jgi:phosphoribosyl-ATP pyrophosphohydrolase/phosphoribosyl-AMP cyclohydrolase